MMLSIALDILVAGLLIATLYYCWRLSRSLSAIRNGKEELKILIDQFSNTIIHAEQNLSEFKQSSGRALDKLQERIDKAQFMADDLAFLIEKSSKIAHKLGDQVNTGKAVLKSPSSPTMVKPAQEQKEPIRGGAERIARATFTRENVARATAHDDNTPPRSEAEKELLKALKIIR